MASCRICKYLNTSFKKYDRFMGYSIGKCMKRQTFIWADIPCPYFKLRDDLA